MPWHVEDNHTDCPGDTPFAVVKNDTGEVVGCHATRDEADAQVKALYASDSSYEEKTAPWRGPLAVEGIVTGDGREFSPGALTWADLPIPLRWNKEDSHGGDAHTVAVNVGRIDKIWRVGSEIMGEGVLNLADSDGQRVYEMIKGQFLRGVSIDADSISDADVEFVWPENDSTGQTDSGEDDLFSMLFAQPEKVIFHAGRIRAATLVDIPAFAEAYIELLDKTGAVMASARAQTFGAVGSHSTATSDSNWDENANRTRLKSPLTIAQVRDAFAWYDSDHVEDGKIVKDWCKFLHHEVSADGTPGAANLAACSAGIGILNGARGGTMIPSADRQGVYRHLARHLRDADREAPELVAAASLRTFIAIRPHNTSTSDASWDGPANEARLSSPLTLAQARAAYAWYDESRVTDGKIVKDACRFIHHEVSADGTPGPANLTACSAGIGVLNGGRGGTTIPPGDIQGVYDHLAAHLRDADREPPELTAALVAHGGKDWSPPKEWFSNPGLSVPTAITVDASGRVYGHAAQWGTCHVGFSDQCVSPPREDAHPYFTTGELSSEDGTIISVGQITVGTSHAPLGLGSHAATEHYDHTGHAVADVSIGNDGHGIWVAGAIRPDVDSSLVHALRASGQVSGDWRRIGGKLRLVGLLAVNVPGFPVPRMRARVASGAQHALVAAGKLSISRGPSMTETQAMRIVMNMLRQRIYKEG